MKGFLAIFLALFLPVFAFAAIENPYVVDEKPQVIFGDSVPVLTYFGLENYTQDYVGGYAHITFTYTHHSCCFASFPPKIYVTNTDPSATSTSIIKANEPLFTLLPFAHPTDWYLYDIQFDASGYTISVKQSGETEILNEHRDIADLADSDWMALANNHPNVGNNQSMAFTPVPIREVPQKNPVIIIPGIMGSARKNDALVIDPILHTYDDLIATLIANGYVEGTDLFIFPYEWRDSNVFTANLLDDKIDEIKSMCVCDKVDIVAHSMGGLVARAYIQSVDYDNDVDQLIFLGTPHRGSPKAYLQWEAGESDVDVRDQVINLFFSAEALRNGYLTVFSYIRNKPILSVQELLPIFDYIKDSDTEVLRSYPANYPRNFFLENLDNNISNLLSSGVEIVNFVGDSEENKTIEAIRVIQTSQHPRWEHGEPEGFSNSSGDNGLERGVGDNTVTTIGSSPDGFISEEIVASHNRIPTVAANRIVKILTGEDSISNIDNGLNVSAKILLMQLLSPIDALVTAPDGKKIGKDFSNNTEYDEIPFAFYSGFETNDEYITILNPLDGEYKVEIQGTGDGGKYELLTSYVSEEFATTTSISGITKPNQLTNLNVRVDNENPEDLSAEREVTLEIFIADINGAYDLGWITDKKTRDALIKQANLIIKFELKKNGKKERQIDKIIIRLLEKELDLLLKNGRINQEVYRLLKEDLLYFISNN